jgi:hypothetical protein
MTGRVALVCALLLNPAILEAQFGEPPRTTNLYQNFPNPFPGGGSLSTCVWFDLARTADVLLEVLDIRGNVVRTLVPSSGIPSRQPAGRYGRATGNIPDGFGCDDRFTWDGVASDGRTVPAGVYLLRMRADGTEVTRRMLFLGR